MSDDDDGSSPRSTRSTVRLIIYAIAAPIAAFGALLATLAVLSWNVTYSTAVNAWNYKMVVGPALLLVAIGVIFTEFQTETMITMDIFYRCTVFPAIEMGNTLLRYMMKGPVMRIISASNNMVLTLIAWFSSIVTEITTASAALSGVTGIAGSVSLVADATVGSVIGSIFAVLGQIWFTISSALYAFFDFLSCWMGWWLSFFNNIFITGGLFGASCTGCALDPEGTCSFRYNPKVEAAFDCDDCVDTIVGYGTCMGVLIDGIYQAFIGRFISGSFNIDFVVIFGYGFSVIRALVLPPLYLFIMLVSGDAPGQTCKDPFTSPDFLSVWWVGGEGVFSPCSDNPEACCGRHSGCDFAEVGSTGDDYPIGILPAIAGLLDAMSDGHINDIVVIIMELVFTVVGDIVDSVSRLIGAWSVGSFNRCMDNWPTKGAPTSLGYCSFPNSGDFGTDIIANGGIHECMRIVEEYTCLDTAENAPILGPICDSGVLEFLYVSLMQIFDSAWCALDLTGVALRATACGSFGTLDTCFANVGTMAPLFGPLFNVLAEIMSWLSGVIASVSGVANAAAAYASQVSSCVGGCSTIQKVALVWITCLFPPYTGCDSSSGVTPEEIAMSTLRAERSRVRLERVRGYGGTAVSWENITGGFSVDNPFFIHPDDITGHKENFTAFSSAWPDMARRELAVDESTWCGRWILSKSPHEADPDWYQYPIYMTCLLSAGLARDAKEKCALADVDPMDVAPWSTYEDIAHGSKTSFHPFDIMSLASGCHNALKDHVSDDPHVRRRQDEMSRSEVNLGSILDRVIPSPGYGSDVSTYMDHGVEFDEKKIRKERRDNRFVSSLRDFFVGSTTFMTNSSTYTVSEDDLKVGGRFYGMNTSQPHVRVLSRDEAARASFIGWKTNMDLDGLMASVRDQIPGVLMKLKDQVTRSWSWKRSVRLHDDVKAHTGGPGYALDVIKADYANDMTYMWRTGRERPMVDRSIHDVVEIPKGQRIAEYDLIDMGIAGLHRHAIVDKPLLEHEHAGIYEYDGYVIHRYYDAQGLGVKVAGKKSHLGLPAVHRHTYRDRTPKEWAEGWGKTKWLLTERSALTMLSQTSDHVFGGGGGDFAKGATVATAKVATRSGVVETPEDTDDLAEEQQKLHAGYSGNGEVALSAFDDNNMVGVSHRVVNYVPGSIRHRLREGTDLDQIEVMAIQGNREVLRQFHRKTGIEFAPFVGKFTGVLRSFIDLDPVKFVGTLRGNIHWSPSLGKWVDTHRHNQMRMEFAKTKMDDTFRSVELKVRDKIEDMQKDEGVSRDELMAYIHRISEAASRGTLDEEMGIGKDSKFDTVRDEAMDYMQTVSGARPDQYSMFTHLMGQKTYSTDWSRDPKNSRLYLPGFVSVPAYRDNSTGRLRMVDLTRPSLGADEMHGIPRDKLPYLGEHGRVSLFKREVLTFIRGVYRDQIPKREKWVREHPDAYAADIWVRGWIDWMLAPVTGKPDTLKDMINQSSVSAMSMFQEPVNALDETFVEDVLNRLENSAVTFIGCELPFAYIEGPTQWTCNPITPEYFLDWISSLADDGALPARLQWPAPILKPSACDTVYSGNDTWDADFSWRFSNACDLPEAQDPVINVCDSTLGGIPADNALNGIVLKTDPDTAMDGRFVDITYDPVLVPPGVASPTGLVLPLLECDVFPLIQYPEVLGYLDTPSGCISEFRVSGFNETGDNTDTEEAWGCSGYPVGWSLTTRYIYVGFDTPGEKCSFKVEFDVPMDTQADEVIFVAYNGTGNTNTFAGGPVDPEFCWPCSIRAGFQCAYRGESLVDPCPDERPFCDAAITCDFSFNNDDYTTCKDYGFYTVTHSLGYILKRINVWAYNAIARGIVWKGLDSALLSVVLVPLWLLAIPTLLMTCCMSLPGVLMTQYLIFMPLSLIYSFFVVKETGELPWGVVVIVGLSIMAKYAESVSKTTAVVGSLLMIIPILWAFDVVFDYSPEILEFDVLDYVVQALEYMNAAPWFLWFPSQLLLEQFEFINDMVPTGGDPPDVMSFCFWFQLANTAQAPLIAVFVASAAVPVGQAIYALGLFLLALVTIIILILRGVDLIELRKTVRAQKNKLSKALGMGRSKASTSLPVTTTPVSARSRRVNGSSSGISSSGSKKKKSSDRETDSGDVSDTLYELMSGSQRHRPVGSRMTSNDSGDEDDNSGAGVKRRGGHH